MSFQAGVFYFDDRPIPEIQATAILKSVAHTDFDAPVSHRARGVFLAHAASQFDSQAAGERQPYLALGGLISFDGRLDNREDLMLCLREYLHDDRSDAALALAAYQRWGSDGLVRLIGDWSLVIWDSGSKCVILASDFAGIRPLYYFVEQDRLLWSTRLDSLVDWTQVSEIDEHYVAGLLVFTGCPNRTPYRRIYSAPPGHSVRVAGTGVVIQRFWNPPVDNTIHYQRDSGYGEHLRSVFRDAVQCRLRTAAPVFAELSGGLDSSSIVCMANRLIQTGSAPNSRIVTLSYEHQGSLDTPFYTAVEELCGFESIHVPTAAYAFLTEGHTGDAIPAFWEPLHTHTAVLAREAGARTYITGLLGDVVMGNVWDDSGQVAGLLSRGHIGPACSQALAWSKIVRVPVTWVLWRAFMMSLPVSLAPANTYRAAEGYYSSKSREDSIAPTFRERTGLSDPNAFFSTTWMEAPPERRTHFRGLMNTLELRRLQPSEPMQHLNHTHPYAHRPLVEFMFSIPADILCRPGEPRRLMRRAFRELWPPRLIQRQSKDSFGAVFLDSLRPLGDGLLRQPKPLQVVERGYVDLKSLTKRLMRLSHSLDCHENQLRQIILLEYWLRNRDRGLRP